MTPLATHSVVTAIPFFVPTVIVVAVIAMVVWRDRRKDDSGGTRAEDESERR